MFDLKVGDMVWIDCDWYEGKDTVNYIEHPSLYQIPFLKAGGREQYRLGLLEIIHETDTRILAIEMVGHMEF